MKTYHVNLVIHDCTSVDAETIEEAQAIASDIFEESGYKGLRYELDVEEES